MLPSLTPSPRTQLRNKNDDADEVQECFCLVHASCNDCGRNRWPPTPSRPRVRARDRKSANEDSNMLQIPSTWKVGVKELISVCHGRTLRPGLHLAAIEEFGCPIAVFAFCEREIRGGRFQSFPAASSHP